MAKCASRRRVLLRQINKQSAAHFAPGFGFGETGLDFFKEQLNRSLEAAMSTILLVVLVLLLVGALPSWPYSRSWGYYPSGGLGLVVVVLLVLLLAGRL
jgi:uncharacterized protein DUF3309